MKESTIGFIGLGLIGGSIARGLKRANKNLTIMAYMRTTSKLVQAKEEGIVDVILHGIDETLSQCDMIFLCTPVEFNASYLEQIRPFLKPGAILTDVGSTKTNIHKLVTQMNMEDVFVGGHPMAGSEKTGYENSTDHLLENAYYIISPTEKNTTEQIERMKQIVIALRAIPLVLDYEEHDYSVAAISHLPHLIASSLVKLVKDNDGETEVMKRIAAGGFKDITRIASSSPVMWE
ncbi:MAG: prephenate dehydrogenase/arogenate dehydrogenase family protein, partial [Lachnospiraceae bacterium]|nr:prephenate dehydrogenase/arogenate dehydrogenase family protein [Lachnospiraceae bacterium]